jgi:hypothetical protein
VRGGGEDALGGVPESNVGWTPTGGPTGTFSSGDGSACTTCNVHRRATAPRVAQSTACMFCGEPPTPTTIAPVGLVVMPSSSRRRAHSGAQWVRLTVQPVRTYWHGRQNGVCGTACSRSSGMLPAQRLQVP